MPNRFLHNLLHYGKKPAITRITSRLKNTVRAHKTTSHNSVVYLFGIWLMAPHHCFRTICADICITHSNLNKQNDTIPMGTRILRAFHKMNIFVLKSKFHYNFPLRAPLASCHHWFKQAHWVERQAISLNNADHIKTQSHNAMIWSVIIGSCYGLVTKRGQATVWPNVRIVTYTYM